MVKAAKTVNWLAVKIVSAIVLLVMAIILFWVVLNNNQPNVIFIAFDGLQAHHLYRYGYALDTTPNLDKFIDSAYLFNNTVSAASWTVPSYMSVFTSTFPTEHRLTNKLVYVNGSAVQSNIKKLSPGIKAIAEVLKSRGYKTAAFTGDSGVSSGFGYDKGFDTYYNSAQFGGFQDSIPRAEAWLKNNSKNKFFLFVHGYDVHGQYAPPGGFDYRYVKNLSSNYTGSTQEQANLREEGLANGFVNITPTDVDFWRAIYDEKINRADLEFKGLVDQLKEMGVYDNSIIVVFSDHGTEFYEHKRFDHGHTLYNELVDTLLAIKLPGQKSGREIKSLVSTVDIFPTVLSILNIKDPVSKQMRGEDLTARFANDSTSRNVYSETDYRLYTHKRSVQTPDGWTLIYDLNTNKAELYNLNADPAEQTDLSSSHPDKLEELMRDLNQHLIDVKSKGPWIIGCLPVYNGQCQVPVNATASNGSSAGNTSQSNAKPALQKRPNILLINIDSLRADHMGIYGYGKNTTPFLDSLFSRGVVFDNAISPAYLTFQSDAAILSGLYPTQNGIVNWKTPLKSGIMLLPEYLKIYQGYRTASFVSPSLWDTFTLYSQFDEYKLYSDMKNLNLSRTEVIDWLKSSDTPSFTFWHVYDVHYPYFPASDEFFNGDISKIHQVFFYFYDYPDPPEVIANASMLRQYARINSDPKKVQLTDDDINYQIANYDTGIKRTDSELHQFFQEMEAAGLMDNTIVIISAEHGEDLGEHGYIFHQDIYNDNIKVPLAIIYPGKPAARVDTLVSTLDITPTLLNITGINVPKTMEGALLSNIAGSSSVQREVFTERAPFGEYSVISGNWKYILRNPDKQNASIINAQDYDPFMYRIVTNDNDIRDELYDLANDPMEKTNLLGKGLPIEARLRSELITFRGRLNNGYQGKNITLMPGILSYP
jgi:choline-sulfatase